MENDIDMEGNIPAANIEEDENSEDEEIVQKVKSKKLKILDDDSDNDSNIEEEDMPVTTTALKESMSMTAEQVLDAVMADCEEDEIEKKTHEKEHAKPIRKEGTQSEKSDVGDSSDEENLMDTIKKQTGGDDLFDTEDGTGDQTNDHNSDGVNSDDSIPRKPVIPDNLFNHSDSENSGCESSGSETRKSDDNQEDGGGISDSEIDPKLLKKLKKGAAKLNPKQREIRKKKEDALSLHSETQRMVRESRVNIPYHQPAPKSINSFLERASMKRQQYKVLHGVRDSTKAKVVQDLLEKTRIKSREKTQEELDKYSDSDEDWNPEIEEEKSLKDRLKEKGSKEVLNDNKADNDECIDSKCDVIEDVLKAGKHQIGDITELPKRGTEDVILRGDSQDSRINSESVLGTDCSVDKGDLVCENSQDIQKDEEQRLKPFEDVDFDWGVGEDGKTKNCDNDVDKNKHNISAEEIVDTNNAQTDSNADNNDNTENIDPTPKKQNASPNTKIDELSSSARKKRKQLALAGIALDNVKPCLTGNSEAFITLEEEPEKPLNPGVAKLLDRLKQHSTKREKLKKDVDISIISKDAKGTASVEELKLNTFVYHVEEEEENPLMKLEAPGAKHVALKEQLMEKIKAKREMARQKRQEAYDFNNDEAGYGEEEEEEEMSDQSDTDVEDDEFDKQFGDDEEELDEEVYNEDEEKNPFADDEADEDGEEGEEIDEEEDDDEEMELKLDVSDDEEESIGDETKIISKKQKEDNVVEKPDTDHFKEPSAVKVSDKPFSMFSRQNTVNSSQFQSGQKSSTVLPPCIEDSQDLYGTIPEIPVTQPKIDNSQDFKFLIEDSQSNMLDADGYLRTESTSPRKPTDIEKEDFSSTQRGMDELLGLCSGKFAQSQAEGTVNSNKLGVFEAATGSNTQNNMDELMGLCSGVFGAGPQEASQNKGTKRKISNDDSDSDSLTALSDDEQNATKDKYHNQDDGDTDHLESEQDEEEEEEEEKVPKFAGFTVGNKHGKIRRDFVEEEAELSGSEYDSDENLDLPEEEDIMEMEEGDRDAAKMDQVKLRDEVGRVHLKRLIDEDKRELLRLQEMYLPDGDLHSEGGGRVRRFRWSNMDDNSHPDMFEGSDNEQEVEDVDDAQWRKERFEREKFLKEQQEKEEDKDADNSQFIQLGKVFLKKTGSTDISVAEKQKPQVESSSTTTKGSETPGFPASFYKLPQQKRGSFLARSKEALAKIAEMTKPTVNPSAGAKSSGKFTFSVISPEKKENAEEVPKGKKRITHAPNMKSLDKKVTKPPLKKPKLDSQNSRKERSIFSHF